MSLHEKGCFSETQTWAQTLPLIFATFMWGLGCNPLQPNLLTYK